MAPPIDMVELKRRQRSRNLALLAILVALCLVFYAITIVRIGGLR